jgi:hypothetical protein
MSVDKDYHYLKEQLKHADARQLLRVARELAAHPGTLSRFLEKGGGADLVECLRALSPGPGEEGQAID